MTYNMKDNGTRKQWKSGAVRESEPGKGRYDLISPIFTKRLAIVMEKGAKKYSSRNWEKGMSLSRYMDALKRHVDQYLEGMEDEDHLGQAAFNLMALIHTKELINRGLLSNKLNDLPNYFNKKEVCK